MTHNQQMDEPPWLPEGIDPALGMAGSPLSARGHHHIWHKLPPLLVAGSLLTRGLHELLDAVYPPSCLSCRAATGAHDALCPQCWSRIKLIEKPYCDRLGVPFSLDTGGKLISPEAFANPPVYGKARAVACFDDGPVRDLVHRLKYGDRVELARPMGLWMARAGAELLAGASLLIPVPLHRRRLFSRRFNQAALLARWIGEHSGIPCDPHILKRVKPTTPQVGKSRAQRADNVQGAFRVDPGDRERIAGKRLLLVDDVLTSGATANAAARILLRAGAAQVDVLVFARVVQDL